MLGARRASAYRPPGLPVQVNGVELPEIPPGFRPAPPGARKIRCLLPQYWFLVKLSQRGPGGTNINPCAAGPAHAGAPPPHTHTPALPSRTSGQTRPAAPPPQIQLWYPGARRRG